MKKLTYLVQCIAIGIAIIFLPSGLNAQDYQIDDGGTVIFNAGTYTGTVTSTTASNASTAMLKTNSGVTLQGTYSGYYGTVEVQDGYSLYLNSSTFGSKFTIGGSSFTSSTIVNIDKTGGITFSGSGSSPATNMITMDKYGRLNINKDLTVSQNIQMNSYDNANAPYIRFYIQSTTPKITMSTDGKTIKTDDPTSNRIDASKHLYFDLTDAPESSVGSQTFVIASFTETGDPTVTGTPSSNVTGDPDGVWDTYSVDVNSHNLRFTATYNPPFENDFTAGGYSNSWTALLTVATDGLGNVETLRKSYAVTSGSSMTKSFTVDLSSYNFSGSQTITISAGKSLGLKGSFGTLNNGISFADVTSQLVLIGSGAHNLLGASFQVDPGSVAAGILKIGDGTTSTTVTLDATLSSKLNSKVSKITVAANGILTVTP